MAAPGGTGGGPGAAYLFSGRDGSLLATLRGERDGDAFGSIVAGDKHGRATPVLVGAPGAGPTRRGRVYFHRSEHGRPTPAAGFVTGAVDTSAAGDGAVPAGGADLRHRQQPAGLH